MLKVLFSASLILLFIATSAQSKIDALHYRYQLEVNDNNDSIYGKASITFATKEDIKLLSFDLSTINNRKKGMMVSEVGFNDPDLSSPKFSQENNKLVIQPQTTISKGDTQSVFIHYKGIPSDGLIISKNKFGHRTFFADNWPNRGHNWLPCIDDPADKASVEFIVTAPQHYQVIANGILIEETNLSDNRKLTHWKEDVPIATKVMVIGVADFAVQHAGFMNCVPISSWVFPENKTEGFKDYALANTILPFFNDYIGPYPYKKLANVQSKTTYGGLENASAIFYYENSVNGQQNNESLIAHEIVHQWFGNMATEKSFAHLWLSEGFATYLTHIYIESKYGTDSLNAEMKKDRIQINGFAKGWENPVVDSVSSYMDLLNPNSYQKGSWILHMLRRQLGNIVFHKAIRSYYANYAGKNADTQDLQKIFENISGKNLDAFFKQWLYRPGLPKLDVNWSYLPKEQKIIVNVKQQHEVAFAFPLEIAWSNSSGSSQIQTINISKQKDTFFIPAKQKPVKLVLDPNTSLLFMGTAIEKK